MATLAELLRQGADKLINLPSEAQRFITNPQAFTQTLTGRNFLPRETGFAAGATGLPAQEMSVLDPNQAPYMQGYSQGEPIGYAGMAAPFAAPAAVATAKALAPKAGMMAENYMVRQGMIQPLTAYHGTPHTIQGQFDINKVGTGEGAQAYGHGMYFAENPNVARSYATTSKYETPSDYASHYFAEANQNPQEAIKLLRKEAAFFDQKGWDKADISKDMIPQIEDALKKGEVSSNLYKVDIPDADIPNMLDWDKPLSQQPKDVQEAFAKFDSIAAKDPERGTTYMQRWFRSPSTAKKLEAMGYKGFRYLDEGSREAGKGTSNFVVFDPSNVKILEQNSKPVTRKELIQEQIDKIE
jgi:hypothetical protein